MLTVFDSLCNDLREPQGVWGRVRLSWRLGSDRVDAFQKTYRVVVVSLSSGEVVWDTGKVASSANAVAFDGKPGGAGDIYSWFVTVTDDAGNKAYGVPSAFVWGSPGDVLTSEYGPQRKGFVWSSDEQFNEELEEQDEADLTDPLWADDLGVVVEGDFVRVCPRVPPRFEFLQGSVLISRGLMIVRCERVKTGVRLAASLPPGMTGELVLADQRRRVASGKHVILVDGLSRS